MSYALLETHHRRLARLRHVEAILSWDEATMMSAKGGIDRANALSVLRGFVHEQATVPSLGKWLASAAGQSDLDPGQRANLREMRRSWVRETALSQELVEAMTTAECRCEQAWRALRQANDFAGFLPLFREVIARKREAAQVLGDKLGLAPYDALIDGFEPGMRAATIASLFSTLGAFLTGFIQRALERQKDEQVVSCPGPFPEASQRRLGLEVMRILGFDFERGRLDQSHHPFCGGATSDVRITTRYHDGDYTKSLMSVIHETGHAKYEQNLPPKWHEQPLGNARSMSVHESQSLFHEMQVARSRPFLEFLAPILLRTFPDVPEAARVFAADNVYRQLTRVRPGLIRIYADEVTYPFHIILRFNLEKALIEGSLAPDDLPEAWDAGMQALLGISSAGNHRDGCMQDVHWPAGLFGYFPTYTLGALTAAQLFRAALGAIPDLTEQLRRGELANLDGWLREKVWRQGSILETSALVEHATGAPLGSAAFEAHLTNRYLRRES